jgi:hypothetical protein
MHCRDLDMQEMQRGEIQVRTGQDGHVELTFKLEGKDVALVLSADEVSSLASHLLAASYSAFIQAGKSDEDAAKKFQQPITPSIVVTASAWHLVDQF